MDRYSVSRAYASRPASSAIRMLQRRRQSIELVECQRWLCEPTHTLELNPEMVHAVLLMTLLCSQHSIFPARRLILLLEMSLSMH